MYCLLVACALLSAESDKATRLLIDDCKATINRAIAVHIDAYNLRITALRDKLKDPYDQLTGRDKVAIKRQIKELQLSIRQVQRGGLSLHELNRLMPRLAPLSLAESQVGYFSQKTINSGDCLEVLNVGDGIIKVRACVWKSDQAAYRPYYNPPLQRGSAAEVEALQRHIHGLDTAPAGRKTKKLSSPFWIKGLSGEVGSEIPIPDGVWHVYLSREKGLCLEHVPESYYNAAYEELFIREGKVKTSP